MQSKPTQPLSLASTAEVAAQLGLSDRLATDLAAEGACEPGRLEIAAWAAGEVEPELAYWAAFVELRLGDAALSLDEASLLSGLSVTALAALAAYESRDPSADRLSAGRCCELAAMRRLTPQRLLSLLERSRRWKAAHDADPNARTR